MKNITSQPCWTKSYTYRITDKLQVSIGFTNNVFEVKPEALFAMAARHNTKRSFLFVSKLLGKHIPVNPYIPLVAGAALGLCYANLIGESEGQYSGAMGQALNNPDCAAHVLPHIKPFTLTEATLFIGFAETATALGHAMFNSFSGKVFYIHTTREVIPGLESTLNFAEEHSHAVEHYCYLNLPQLPKIKTVVLVDDELTTGNTALNIIRAYYHKFGCRDYVVASLLDWRSAAAQQAFDTLAAELSIRIRSVALVQGLIEVSDQGTVPWAEVRAAVPQQAMPKWQKIDCNELLGLGSSGQVTARTAINAAGRDELEALAGKIGHLLKSKRTGPKTLCLGTGEFMYLPLRIASHMGQGVYYQSTTRSPIYPAQNAGYAIQNATVFASPADPQVTNYLYNVPRDHYDELFVFLEKDIADARLAPMLQALSQLGISKLFLIICGR